MSVRGALAVLLFFLVPPEARGQMPLLSRWPGSTDGTQALRQSLDEAWSVVDPNPLTKVERTEVETPTPIGDPRAGKLGEPESLRVIRRKPETAPAALRESRDAPTAATASNSWSRTLASLAGVVAMIMFLAWGAKSVGKLGVAGARPRKTGLIEVISRTMISQKQSVCLVRVGPRMVLIGVTPERMQALDVITDAEMVSRLAGDALNVERARQDGAFIRRLEKEDARFSETESQSATGVESANALRDRLKCSVARLRQAAAR